MNASELETALIGSILDDNTIFSRIDVTSNDFSNATTKNAFMSIEKILQAGDPADEFSVAENVMTVNGQDIYTFLERSRSMAATSFVAEKHAKLIKKNSAKRKAQKIANEMHEAVAGGNMDAIDIAIRELMQIGQQSKSYECSMYDAAQRMFEKAMSEESEGVTSGLADLDKRIGGFMGGELYVVAARPAMGKTAFLLNLMDAHELPCGMISAEMGAESVAERVCCMNSGVNMAKLKAGYATDEEAARFSASIGRMSNEHARINEKPAPSILDIQRQAREWAINYKIKAIYVDYLQRIKATDQTKPNHLQVGEVIMSLKELARELNIPVIVLAQVSREVDKRPDKRPGASDIKDSGIIEQEADMILTLYRDDVYNENSDMPGTCEVNLVKNRRGPTGRIMTVWRKEFMKFEDYAYVQQ